MNDAPDESATPESTDETARGGTNWRRFAVVMGLPTVAAVGILVGVANGALAASFSVSGQTFKISATKLDGDGFAQYGGEVHTKNGTAIPVAVSGINHADLTDLCQSVKVPNLPITLTIRAGGEEGNPAHADGLLIGMSELSGDAEFTNINIGQDASSLTKGGSGAHGDQGGFGQEADHVVIDGLTQTAYSTSAGTFKLKGLNLKINLPVDGKPVECF